uniref:zinc finger protein 391-like isoform X2 n=1 Tax=Doryrhamphus excisus TaxID=161450 RepID=UPI0025AE3561|nr:zinc finger protein 391-like isoform X2 [Doryrhamphus excisus]
MKKRRKATTDGFSEVLGRKMASGEEEHSRKRQENEICSTDLVLHTQDVQQQFAPRPQGRGSTVKQENPQPSLLKEEDQELRIAQEGERLLGRDECFPGLLPQTDVSGMTEDGEDKPPETSRLHRRPAARCSAPGQVKAVFSSVPETKTTKAEADVLRGETHHDLAFPHITSPAGVPQEHPPQPHRGSSALRHPLHVKEEEAEPEAVHVKDEEEELYITQEEAELNKVPQTGVSMKTEDEPPKSSQLHPGPNGEETREAEHPSSSSTEADGDHCGGSPADKLLAPLSDSEHTTSHSPDTDDEDSTADMTCHHGNTRLKCQHCDKTFGCRSHLKRHVRVHTGEKPFMCSVCGKTFSRKANLTIHTRIHTGEKPFPCSVCGRTFVQIQCLKMHMTVHTGEKTYSCSICHKSFCDRTNLLKHTRRHTGEKPYSCSVCSKTFSVKANLQAHTRTHTGEKPYSCSVCNKSFCQRSTFVRHTRTHTGEKVFRCSVCAERFSYKYQLSNHTCAGENSGRK